MALACILAVLVSPQGLEERLRTLEERAAELEAKRREVQRRVDEELDRASADYEPRREALQREYENDGAAVTAAYQKEREKIEAEYIRRFDALEKSYDAKFREAEEKFDSRIEELDAAHERRQNEIESALKEFDAKEGAELAELARDIRNTKRRLYLAKYPHHAGLARLGIRAADLSEEQKKKLNVDRGVFVMEVLPESMLRDVRPWTLITDLDDRPVESVEGLRALLKDLVPYETIPMRFRPAFAKDVSLTRNVQLILGSFPKKPPSARFMDPSKEQLEQMGITHGVIVIKIEGYDQAEGAAVVPGDVLLTIDGREAKSAQAVEGEFRAWKGSEPLRLELRDRSGKPKKAELRPPAVRPRDSL